jgi:DNA polymerase III alpha subunit
MMSFDPPLDDAYTYEQVFQSGDTTGIFQFE